MNPFSLEASHTSRASRRSESALSLYPADVCGISNAAPFHAASNPWRPKGLPAL